MPGDYARSVQILVQIAGNPEQQLTEINKLVDQLNGKKITLTDSMAQVSGGANNAVSSLKQVSSSTQDVNKNAADLGTKAVSSFDKIKSSVSQLNEGVQNLGASLAGIAAGGAISGLSWKASADFKLLNDQIDKAVAANKSLGITTEELDAFVKLQAEAGEGTTQDTKSEIYTLLNVGSKYLKGDSQAKLNQADAIGDFWFANQERMKANGINSPSELIRRSVRTEGKMGSMFKSTYATAIGVDPEGKEMSSAKSRMKFLTGQETDMKKEMDKRPWEDMLVSVTKLKYAIGDGLAPAMTGFIKLLTAGVKLFNMIPGGPTLIGLAGGLLAMVSTMTLLNAVLMPGVAILKQLILLTNIHTLAQARDLVVSKARIVTDWLGVTSLGARTVATTGLTGATIGLAAAEWAALSPLLLIAIPLIAVAGLLYLAEKRTNVFSNALKQLSETEMSQDVVQWFKDVGYWAGYAIDKIGGAIGTDLSNNIAGLNSLYKLVKSGGSLLLGSSESEKDNGVVQKIANPLFATKANTESINEAITWIKGILDTGWGIFSRIYAGIVNFPKNAWNWVVDSISNLIGQFVTYIDESISSLLTKFTTFVTDIKTSLANLIPSWMKEDDDSSTASGSGSRSSGSSGSSSVDSVFHNDIKNVQKQLDNGEHVSSLSTDMGNPSGLAKSAYNAVDSASGGRVSGAVDSAKKSIAALSEGGFINKSGLVMLHSNESVIPADVGNSSRLQNVLESIAYGGSSTSSTVNNQPIIHIHYEADSKRGILLDEPAFERKVADIMAKKLRQLNGY